jgi:hypothetical protein
MTRISSNVTAAADATAMGAPDYCLDTGSVNALACNPSPALAAYTAGKTVVRIKIGTANTGSTTGNFGGLGAVTIQKFVLGSLHNLVSGDLVVGQVAEMVYDGAVFQLQNPTANILFNQISGMLDVTAQLSGPIGSAQMAAVNTRRTICLAFGANNGSALADADLGPQSRQYFVNAPWTLVEMEVAGDAGTPNIILGRSRAGTIVNVTSAALATAASGGIACSNTGGTTGIDGTTTCGSTLQNTGFNAGDWITAVSGTAGGTAKEMTACLTFTVN